MLILNLKLAGSFLVVVLLLTSFFCFQPLNAVKYTPDVSVVRVSQYDCYTNYVDEWGDTYSYLKLVPGYTVTVQNTGNGASKNTTMNFYIKTFDNKTLVKYIKVPALNPGQAKRISFSCNAGSDGSFKEGYVIINPARTFKESNFVNNIRKFGLQEVILKNSTKTVIETYYKTEYTPISGNDHFIVPEYNSTLRGHSGINHIKVYFYKSGVYYMYPATFRLNIPAYLQNNTTVTITKAGRVISSKHPNYIINSTCMELRLQSWETSSYIWDITVDIDGINLENQSAFREPFRVWNNQEINMTSIDRDVTEYYTHYETVNNTYTSTYTGTSYNYAVHHENVTSIKVLGNNRGLYTAGWFITPLGNVNSVTALYGSNSKPGTLINNGRYGVSQRIRDIDNIGFVINGNNLQGFNNFRSLGFNSWTWRTDT